MARKGHYPYMITRLLVVVLLTGCASYPTEDVQCEQIGKYASSIAKMRFMGMSFDDVDELTQVPTASYIPAKFIAYEVLASTLTPHEANIKYTAMCTDHGSLRAMLRHMNEHRPTELKLTKELNNVNRSSSR